MERVARWPQRQPRQVGQRTRAPQAVHRFSTGRSVRGPCATGVNQGNHETSKLPSLTWRGVVEEEPRPTAWDGARRALSREDNHAKTTSAQVLRGRLAGSLRGEARAGRAPRKSSTIATTFRSRSHRPGEVSTNKSIGHRRVVERVARWPQRQPRQVRQQARAPRAVGWYSTRRSDHGSRGTGVYHGVHEIFETTVADLVRFR